MILYDVRANGFYAPLSREQIAKLFSRGLLDRDTPCKAVATNGWRTVDELFPMLKYDSSLRYSEDEDRQNRDIIPWLFALGGALLALGAFAVYFFSPLGRSIDASQSADRVIAALPQTPGASFPTRNWSGQGAPKAAATPIHPPQIMVTPGVERTFGARNEAIAQEQTYQERLQRQRDQAALADRIRNEQASADAASRVSAGQDWQIPLDQNQIVLVGGRSVTVRIHDNDVTSFDAWIDGVHRREIKKEKGISHSGTDETLIYRTGNAALYYVWEISGKLNHCLLRVR